MPETGPMYVMQTWFVEDLRAIDGRYVIELAERPYAPRERFITRDAQVYQDALDAEGAPVQVIATYRPAGKDRILERLDPAQVETRREA